MTEREASLITPVPSLYEVANYLRLSNWRKVHSVLGKYSAWEKQSGGTNHYALLPANEWFSDYKVQMDELMKVIASVEGVSIIEAVEFVMNTLNDFLQVRLATNTEDGTLPLEEGIGAIQNLRELVLASACSIVKGKDCKIFGNRKPDQAINVLKSMKLGQTKRGSYIFTVLSPIQPILQTSLFEKTSEEELKGPDETLARKVMLHLSETIQTIDNKLIEVAQSGSSDAITSINGISANLVDSIVGLQENSKDGDVTFNFSWAAARLPEVGRKKDCSRFSLETRDTLREISRVLKETDTITDATLTGTVKSLEWKDKNKGIAHIKVDGYVDGNRRFVIIEVIGREHEKAIAAYREGTQISCVGDIVKEGRLTFLRNPKEIMPE